MLFQENSSILLQRNFQKYRVLYGIKEISFLFFAKGTYLLEHTGFNWFFVFDFKSRLRGYLCFIRQNLFLIIFCWLELKNQRPKKLNLVLKSDTFGVSQNISLSTTGGENEKNIFSIYRFSFVFFCIR